MRSGSCDFVILVVCDLKEENMILQDTLLIRHLPSELTNEEKGSFLKHFGAVNVKILGPETKRNNLVFARLVVSYYMVSLSAII